MRDEALMNDSALADNHNQLTSTEDQPLQEAEGPVEAPVDFAQPGPSQVLLKKKLGRPPKSTIKNLKPTRKSQRATKCPKVINYNHQYMISKRLWTQDDQRALLAGLEDHGPNNLKKLQEYLPHKSENDISNQIRMWRTFADKDLEKKLLLERKQRDCGTINSVAKLNEWIEHFEGLNEFSSIPAFAMMNVFSFIAEFGEFPEPDQCDGVDFRALYRYLHSLVNGRPFYGVNSASARELNDCITNLFRMVREYDRVLGLKTLLLFHGAGDLQPQPIKNYSRSSNRGENIPIGPGAILNIPHINPLNIPPSKLTKPATMDPMDWDDSDDEQLT